MNLKSKAVIERVASPSKGTAYHSHPKYTGIRLAVGTRSKRWQYVRRVGGKVATTTLGAFPDIPDIDKAQEIALGIKKAAKEGTDAAATGVYTLQDALNEHLRSSSAGDTHKEWTRRMVATHLAELFARPVEKVKQPHLEEVLQGKPGGTAKHLRGIIRLAYRRAAARRNIRNEAEDLKPVRHSPRSRTKFNAGVQAEWARAYQAIQKRKERSLVVGSALEFALFTGMRIGHIRRLTWDSIDFENGFVTFFNAKNDQEHVIPLSARALDVLRALPQHRSHVFPQATKDAPMAHPHGIDADGMPQTHSKDIFLNPHDCRRLFTTAARRAKVPAYVIDQLRADTEKSVQDRYDQGSVDHSDAEKVTRELERLCQVAPSNVVELKAHTA